MYFVFTHENRTMKPAEMVLGRWGGRRGRMVERVYLRYIISTYINIIMYPLYNYYMLIQFFKNKKEFFIKNKTKYDKGWPKQRRKKF
jgi:hypothetical protein